MSPGAHNDHCQSHLPFRPLSQSVISLPTSFYTHCFLSPPRSLDKHDLQLLRVACTQTRPHFPLLLPVLSGLCPHLSIKAARTQEACCSGPSMGTSSSPRLQTSFSPRLGQRKFKLGSSDE